ncbi:MAG: cytochrome c biogenesis protein CcsA [bacterium]
MDTPGGKQRITLYEERACYLLACLAGFASFLWRPAALRPAALALLGSAFAVHTVGLLARILLQGRPPVTNLYSSAVFVGWVAAGLGTLLEARQRDALAAIVAGAIGFATLIVAHHLSLEGDSMEMMRAVLDSNFWLATHVVTVTIGYAATFLAGALGIAYLLRVAFDRSFAPGEADALAGQAYGVVCFALFFSFVGTVLGGIWADQSWGRFWGWDPKENGALLIVLWNAIILHARGSRLTGVRGLMVMMVFGNVITSLSWFGVNMLGIGLHSYGFMDRAFWWLAGFVASHVAVMCLGLLRPRRA